MTKSRFQSNWYHPSVPSVSAIQRLLRHPNLNRRQFSAIGHADTRPISPNVSAEGRTEYSCVKIKFEIPAE